MTDLRFFCGEGLMDTPFSKGRFTYATNGFVLVRVPFREGFRCHDLADHVAQYFAAPVNQWFAVPAVDIETCACKECNGRGKIYRCPECDGEGELVFSTSFHEYEVVCDTCDGDGMLSAPRLDGNDDSLVCSRCKGEGKVVMDSLVEIGGAQFSSVTLSLVRRLPDVAIGLVSDNIARIRFAGGDGVLMTARQSEDGGHG